MPQVLTKLLELFGQATADVPRLLQLVEMDPALSARILAASNSAAFRRGSRVMSLHEGINLMGWDMIKTLTLSASVHTLLNQFSEPANLDLTQFWRHSLRTALLSKMLAGRIPHASSEEAYLAGLLHDIGTLALQVSYPVRYAALFYQHADSAESMLTERHEFGTDHCELGASLIGDWQIGTFLQDAVAYHHAAPRDLVNATSIVKTTHMANLLSHEEMQISSTALATAQDWFGLQADDVMRLVLDSEQQVTHIAQSLGIDIYHPAPTPSPRPNPKAIATGKPSLKEVLAKGHLADQITRILKESRDVSELSVTLQQIAWILFGASHTLVFELDHEGRTLKGRALTPDQRWIDAMTFASDQEMVTLCSVLAWDCHLVADAQCGDRPLDFAERQILRMCGSDALFCLPLTHEHRHHGVMAFAVNREEASAMVADPSVTNLIAAVVAGKLYSTIAEGSTQQPIPAAALDQQTLRKFVHETRNPLTTIKNYLGVMHRKIERNGMQAEELQIIDEEIDRVADLIRWISGEQQEHLSAPRPVDINQALRDVVTLHMEPQFKPSGIGVEFQLDEGIPTVMLPPQKLRQVLLNLIRNAAEAMPTGGTLCLSTAFEHRLGSAPNLLIQISDTGVGMAPSSMGQLFRPVNSTKGRGHQGLGLSIVADTMAEIGGDIRCRSSLGQGTCFELRFPLSDPDHQQQPSVTPPIETSR